MRNFPEIRPIKDAAEREAVNRAAAADGHELFLPTHVFRKGGEIVGYSSICLVVPLRPGPAQPIATQFQAWFHSRKLSARESFNLFNSIESIIATAVPPGCPGLVPCPKDSPFYGVMPGMGYAPIADTVVWGKVLD